MKAALVAGCLIVALTVLAAVAVTVVLVLRARRRRAGPALATAPAVAAERLTQPEVHAPRTAIGGRIVWTGGPLAGREQTLPSDGLWIGRETPAQVVVQSTQISRLHCWVGPQEGEVFAVDEGSSNGTLVMGQPIGRRALRDGDVVVLARGAASFRYESADAAG